MGRAVRVRANGETVTFLKKLFPFRVRIVWFLDEKYQIDVRRPGFPWFRNLDENVGFRGEIEPHWQLWLGTVHEAEALAAKFRAWDDVLRFEEEETRQFRECWRLWREARRKVAPYQSKVIR